MSVAVIQAFPTEYQEFWGMTGPEVSLLYSMLRQAGFAPSAVEHIVVAPKKPPKLTATVKAALRKSAEDDLRRYGITHVLVLGNETHKLLFGNKVPYEKNRGKAFIFNGITYISTYPQERVHKEPELRLQFLWDLKYFKRVVEGRKPLPLNTTKVIRTKAGIEELRRKFNELPLKTPVVYDIETSGLVKRPGDKLFMVGLGLPDSNYILPVEPPAGIFKDLTSEDVLEFLSWLFMHDFVFTAHNAKFDNRWLRLYGVEPYVDFDTYNAAYTLRNNVAHGLKPLSKGLLDEMDYDDGVEFKKEITVDEFLAMAKYCAKDVQNTGKLQQIFAKKFDEDLRLKKVFFSIIMPGERVLQSIEAAGMWVDLDGITKLRTEYVQKAAELKLELDKMVPPTKEWNYSSTADLREILYSVLKLKCPAETATGEPSTGKLALKKLADVHPFPKLLLEYRRYKKALEGFLETWPEHVRVNAAGETRLHATYNIARTATGRLSSENPNLQQVPRNPEIRGLFGAPPGKFLIEADMSQIELRVVAVLANEPTMKKVYMSGGDIHTETACGITGKQPSEILKEERSRAKPVNFGYVFGMGWKSFIDYAKANYDTDFTQAESKHYRQGFFNKYPRLLYYHQQQQDIVKANNCVRTGTGRIRWLENAQSPDNYFSSEACRQGINTPVQSLASDMTMLALIRIHSWLKSSGYSDGVRIVGQVHDAIMLESDFDEVLTFKIACVVKKIMEKVSDILRTEYNFVFDVPVVADAAMGSRWGKTKGLDEIAKKFSGGA